ncbi:MAG: hypothetical protein LRZ94_01210 [Candidatus Pacebacteria bacterium]|nr:hypothetical protein [Candidatus Paceibacterota bacterium]
MSLPKKIKIGGVDYNVITKEKVQDRGVALMGKTSYSTHEISIDGTMPIAVQRLTLMHEVMHGVLHHIAEQKLCEDERFVNALANTWHQVLVDNPGIKWK